jgi:hypothetical protein
MPAGRLVHIASSHLGNYDFQVWQRKNVGIGEPFATALFVREPGGQWTAFLLDFEDTYRPSIDLRREDSGIAVFRNKARWGYFDEVQQVLKREPKDTSFPVQGIVIDSDPPGDWWSKQSSIR